MRPRSLLGLVFIALFNLATLSPAFATGDIEPKDTVQNPGPGGLDVPTEKLSKSKPAPSPSPLPKPKTPEKPKSSY